MERSAKAFLAFAVVAGMIGMAIAGAMTMRSRAPVTQPHNFAQDTSDHQWKPTARWEEEREASLRDQAINLARNPATLSKFSRIRPGMTHAEVIEIMAIDGDVLSESELAGYRTVMLSWQNRDGGNMNVMIQNNRVVSKAQFGL